MHAKPRFSTPINCKKYCTKDEPAPDPTGRVRSAKCYPWTRFEHGVFDSNPGKRSDIEHAHSLLKAGMDVKKVIDQMPSSLRVIRNMERYVELAKEEAAEEAGLVDTKIFFIDGTAGAGKTRFVRDWAKKKYPALKRQKDRLAIINLNEDQFFGNYDCQPVVILDEFQFTRNLTYERLLTLTGKNEGQAVRVLYGWRPWRCEWLFLIRNKMFFDQDGTFVLDRNLEDSQLQALVRRMKFYKTFNMQIPQSDPREAIRKMRVEIDVEYGSHVSVSDVEGSDAE